MENHYKMGTVQICRTCMCETQHYKTIYSKIDGERTLSDVISTITNIDINSQNSLPEQICKRCVLILCKTDAFIQRVLKVDKLLNKFYSHGHRQTNSIRLASHVKHEIGIQEDLLAPYQCSVCLMKFPELSNLEKHVSTCLSSTNNVLCEVECTPISASVLFDEETNKPLETVKEESLNYDFDNCFDSSDCYDYKHENNAEEKVHLCSCGSMFDTKDAYKTHLRTDCLESKVYKHISEHNDNSFICDKCNLHCENTIELRKHKQSHKKKTLRHNGENSEQNKHKHQCSLCMRKFVNESSLALHIKKHEEDANIKHTCATCKREFKHEAHLKNHILLLHTKEKGFTCDLCTKSFTSSTERDIHRQMHNERKHQCNLCQKSFEMLSTLKDHMRTHTGEKPFLCSECGKGFSQKNNLAQHMRRHQGLKPFKCDICEKGFVSKGELVAHARKHSGAHPFICPDCGNGFTTSSSLVKHRRTHSGERPYACDLCSMRFAASGTLTIHRRIHTGERPYCCSYCTKSFVQRNDLIAHIRCHTGERPFVCSTCGQAFRKGSALKTHLKLHAKEPLQLQRDNMMMQGVSVLLAGMEGTH